MTVRPDPARGDVRGADKANADKASADKASADDVTDAVLRASRLLVGLSARSIAAVDDAITLAQFRLLVVLHTHGPLNQAALAEHLAVKPSTVTRMIDRLTTAAMVDRTTSTHSRREVTIALTETGTSVVTRVTRLRRTEIARIVANMPTPHRTRLVDALDAFSEAGGEPPITNADARHTPDWN